MPPTASNAQPAGYERKAPSLVVDVVSDIVCPWCFIGKRKLEAALADLGRTDPSLDVAIRWHPFQLNPDLPANLEKVVLKCLEREPDKRYPFLSVLVRDLQSALYV